LLVVVVALGMTVSVVHVIFALAVVEVVFVAVASVLLLFLSSMFVAVTLVVMFVVEQQAFLLFVPRLVGLGARAVEVMEYVVLVMHVVLVPKLLAESILTVAQLMATHLDVAVAC